MRNFNKSNRITKRRNNTAGEFTTINYAALRDPRLTPLARLLLIEVLSDSDNFTFSETLYMNRLGIKSKPTYYVHLNKLIECGYVKKDDQNGGHFKFYTISEYGNLNGSSTEKKLDGNPEVVVDIQHSLPDKNESGTGVEVVKKTGMTDKEFQVKLTKYLLPYANSFTEEELSKVTELVLEHGVTNDFYGLKPKLDRAVKKLKTRFYTECIALVRLNTGSSKAQKVFKEWLKDEIFNKNNMLLDAKKKYMHLKIQFRIKGPSDPETDYIDRMENPED